MTARRRISRARVVAAAVAALVLGACGAGSSGSGSGASGTTRGEDAGRIVAASADATNAAKSARISMTIDLSVSGHAGVVTADGAFDFAGRAGVMTMDMSSMGLSGVQGRIEVRIVDGVMYMNLGSLLANASSSGSLLFGGKAWLSLDFTKAGANGVRGMGGFGSLGTSDPTSTLDSLRGVGADVREVGHDTVRGVATTHYRAEIDLARALDKLPPAQRARASRSLQAFGGGHVPTDVWIDAQGRLRKLVMHLDAGAAQERVGAMTMELYDFGTKVDVQAPPAEETFDLSSMMGRLGQIDRIPNLHDLSSS